MWGSFPHFLLPSYVTAGLTALYFVAMECFNAAGHFPAYFLNGARLMIDFSTLNY